MPHQTRMHQKITKKGMVLEALLRIILTVILLFIVFKVGMRVGSIFFGESQADASVKKMADALSQPGEGTTAVRIGLDSGDAIIGFSQAAKEFRCYGCPQGVYSPVPYYSYVSKPSTAECANVPCICSCKGIRIELPGQLTGREGEQAMELRCAGLSCLKLANNLPDQTPLKAAYPNTTSLANYPFWKGGFFFVNAGDIGNGLPRPQSSVASSSVAIERKRSGTGLLANACPPQVACIQQN